MKASSLRTLALRAIQSARQAADRKDRATLDLLGLALRGKKALSQGGFDKVVKMVDQMVGVLKKEQGDDNDKKEYCGLQLDSADDSMKALERKIAENGNAIA